MTRTGAKNWREVRIGFDLRTYLLVTLFLTPFLDMLNGIIGEGSFVGKLLRGLIVLGNIAAVLYTSSRERRGENLVFLLVCAYLAAIVSVQAVLSNGESLMTDLGLALKLLLFLSEVVLLKNCIERGDITSADFEKFWRYSFIVIPVSLFIALFTERAGGYGLGGNKGFFISVNALTIVLIVQVNLSVYMALKKKASWLVVAINLLAVFLVGTKTPYFFLAMSVLAVLLFDPHGRRRFLKYIALFAVLLVVLVVVFFSSQFEGIIEYQMYFIGQALEDGSWINYLLSGRDALLISGWKVATRDFPFSLCFGMGSWNLFTQNGLALGLDHTRGIEMDFFEIWFSFGIFVALALHAPFVSAFRHRTKDHETNVFFDLILVSVLLYSLLGGHVLVEAFGATYTAALLAYRYALSREDPAEKRMKQAAQRRIS